MKQEKQNLKETVACRVEFLTLSRTVADLKIAYECFRYLHQVFGNRPWLPGVDGLGPGHNSSVEILSVLEVEQREAARKYPQDPAAKWPYLRYAAESWFVHARRGFKISKVEYFDLPAHGWLLHQFFNARDDIRKPWIEICGDPKIEILARSQGKTHIAACLGLAPLALLVLREIQPGTFALRRRLFSGFYYSISPKECIPISLCTPSLLMSLDKNGNTPSELYDRKPQHQYFQIANRNEYNRKNRSGDTPLHLAFQFDHMDIVEVLLREGADPAIKNDAGLTPSELGAKLGGRHILERDCGGAC
ncbi:hypothetical protein B9Z19DRAFT_1158619 [Tuber borchii]|uniref:Uncharacterized protein n=1 Tax=Tuber borchii TaxID=42251 RepID=A0A2T7A8Z0_TUBBO|nr:hypothetical protein B9Z19DRAFT_1158619 [Tuber borchii]